MGESLCKGNLVCQSKASLKSICCLFMAGRLSKLPSLEGLRTDIIFWGDVGHSMMPPGQMSSPAALKTWVTIASQPAWGTWYKKGSYQEKQKHYFKTRVMRNSYKAPMFLQSAVHTSPHITVFWTISEYGKLWLNEFLGFWDQGLNLEGETRLTYIFIWANRLFTTC